jgi:hypothetical protein
VVRKPHRVRAAAAAPATRTLVVVGGVIQLQRCDLYAHWTGMLDAHHVIPHSWWVTAAKEVDTPMKNLCPNCHYNTHVCIDGLIKGQDISLLPLRCQALARAAIDGAAQFGLTPALTL